MAKHNKKKRQHYVPRLILRNFSPDGRRISLVVLRSGQRCDDASLRDQCYGDYFYGKDLTIEDAFKAQEDALSKIIRQPEPTHLEALSDQQLTSLKIFVHFQRARTEAAAELTEDVADALAKKMIELDPRMAAVDPERWRLKLNEPQFMMLNAAASATPLILDLHVKFITNDTSIGFVISDAPVAIYNQWAEHHPKFHRWRGAKGIASKGVQWFYPVSPTLCIAVFDPTTYEYGGRKTLMCRAAKKDVARLNTLQALHARNTLYFRSDLIDDEHLSQLRAARTAHPRLNVPKMYELRVTTTDDSRARDIFNLRAPDPRISAKFHFVRVIDHRPYRGYDRLVLPLRQPELVAMHRSMQGTRDRTFTFAPPEEGEDT